MSTPRLYPTPDQSRLDLCNLSDYWRYQYEVRAVCRCGSDRYVPTGAVINLLGGRAVLDDHTIPRLQQALVCSLCGQRGPEIVVRKDGVPVAR